MSADEARAAAQTPDFNYADFVRQRKDEVARNMREQRERSLRIVDGIDNARVRRAFMKAEADHERDIAGFWRRFFRGMPRQRDGVARHVERHRSPDARRPSSAKTGSLLGPKPPPSGAIQLASYGGPILDRKGRRGVYLSASYLSSRTATYGCARRLVRYVTDPDHVEWLNGVALCGSNVGDSRSEMSAAFGLVEDLNRAARANAKVAFHIIVQLPHDVTPAERGDVMRRWCDEQFGVRNLPFVWAVHTPDADGDQRNCHGHVAVSFRPLVRVAPFTWDAGRELKAELDNSEEFRIMRHHFARVMTEVARVASKNREYTALSHAARGLKIKPTEHLGAHKTRLVREGKYVSAEARNRAKIKRNEALLEIERLKRRRAAMERRLAHVRRIEARAVVPIRQAARPTMSVGAKVGWVAASPRVEQTRPTEGRFVAAKRGVATRAPLNTPTLAPRLANPITVITEISTTAQFNLGGSITYWNGVKRADRPAANPVFSKSDIVIGVSPDAPARPFVPKPLKAQRPVRSDSRVDIPSPSSRVRLVKLSEMALWPSAGQRNTDMDSAAMVQVGARARPVPLPASAAITMVSTADRPASVSSVRAIALAVVGRVTRVAQSSTSSSVIVQPRRTPSATHASDIDLHHSAFGERAARRRSKAKARAPQAVLAAIARLDWNTTPSAQDAALDRIDAFDQADPLVAAPTIPITERVRAAQFYIHDDRTGRLDLGPRAVGAFRITDAQLEQEPEQAALAASLSVAERASERRLTSAETTPVADFAIVRAEEMLRAIPSNRSRIASRKAKTRARSQDAEIANRGVETISDFPTLADIPTGEWSEEHPRTSHEAGQVEGAEDRAHLATIARIDPYVVDLRDGTFDIDYQVLQVIGVDAVWLERSGVQRGLADIRTEQQHVVAMLTDEANRRPLDFARHGKSFWPRDLVPADLARLDRWAADDGFQVDIMPIERTLRAAYKTRDKQRDVPIVTRQTAPDAALNTVAAPMPDGFGGMRATPLPPNTRKEVAVKLVPFDKKTGRPNKPLLMLLHHCGEHPHTVAFANDGRLTSVGTIPALVDPLFQMWRHNDHVQALMVETVSASRTAGRAVWPQQHAAAIQALSPPPQPSRIPPPDHELTPRR